MSDQSDHAHRPLYACNACDVVYSKYNPPSECRVCGNESFVEVVPKTHPS